jgi:glycerol-3-phosphate dehydrogenase
VYSGILENMSILRDHKTLRPKVVIIGGGATGVGIARDAAARGFSVTLVERGELGSGTSGHFHGILHSGARYVINDPEVATECYEENQILRKIVPSAIRDTGGLFVALDAEEAAHADVLMQACRQAGIPTNEISREEALRAEPNITPMIRRAFTVPDGFIDGEELLRLNKHAAVQAEVPATFLTHHDVVGFQKKDGRVTAVLVQSISSRTVEHIECDYVVNAAGVWAGDVAQLAAIPLTMIFDKGTMIDFKQGFTNSVLNRCRPEGDGDLLVPHGSYSVLGTTARVIDSTEACQPTQEEADVLMKEGAAMVPQLQHAEVTKVYAGVRPLFREGTPQLGGTTRSISRSFHVLDHEEQGIVNLISVVGGKVTLYRRMAEEAVDILCAKSGLQQKSTTASVAIF